MGDSGEGLVDAESRIQERIEELQLNRAQARKAPIENAEQLRKIELLQLARKEMTHQLERATHAARRMQITGAIEEIDRRISELQDQ